MKKVITTLILLLCTVALVGCISNSKKDELKTLLTNATEKNINEVANFKNYKQSTFLAKESPRIYTVRDYFDKIEVDVISDRVRTNSIQETESKYYIDKKSKYIYEKDIDYKESTNSIASVEQLEAFYIVNKINELKDFKDEIEDFTQVLPIINEVFRKSNFRKIRTDGNYISIEISTSSILDIQSYIENMEQIYKEESKSIFDTIADISKGRARVMVVKVIVENGKISPYFKIEGKGISLYRTY